MTLTERFLSQVPYALEQLRQLDQRWYQLRCEESKAETVIHQSTEPLQDVEFDIVFCGGTLGILLATALQHKGWKVALIERGQLRGRAQEWNISRQELTVFLDLDLLTETELKTAIATEYNPARISFYQGYELWVKDVLNIGVDPVYLLEILKQKFLSAGGKLLENTAFKGATIHPDSVCINTDTGKLNSRLLVDAMGHFSPIVQQIRAGQKPDGVCLVVGSCAKNSPQNDTGDLIASITPILNQCQYFWEAFPARDGRTTYLFTYVDTHRDRFSLEFLMEEYLRLLPSYQQCDLEKLKFERFLAGFFPAYQKSPIKMPFPRLLAIGDSAGGQSPVSFGGFGAMVRHLKRLTQGIHDALSSDSLQSKDLALLQPYQPNISVTWLFQKTMSVGINQTPQPNQINELMSGVFRVMDRLGDNVLKPFLQDVIQFSALSKTLPLVNPKLVIPLLPQVGLNPLLNWSFHYFNLAIYSGLYPLAKWAEPWSKNFNQQQYYAYQRWLDAFKYGSGGDY